MYFLVFLTLLVVLILLSFSIGIIPEKCAYDYDSPLNFLLFQEPNAVYSDQLVNMWVDKTWRPDGKRIPCRMEKTASLAEPQDRRIVVYSHGNAENLLTCSQFIRELSGQMDMDVVAWDYSGYGLNEPDKFERTPAGINLSLQTIVEDLVGQGYRLKNMILWGYSLGTGPSTHLAASLSKKQSQTAGLVLMGAYASVLDVVEDQTSKDISQWFTERWSTKDVIGDVQSPILILHGQSDGLISVKHADILAERASNAKKVILPNTGHTKFHWGECAKEVKKWMKEKKIF